MKKAALINDLSGFGRCSLTAAIPVISVMGIQACPLPTAVLTSQTGFKSFYCDDYTDKIDIYTKEWQKLGKSFDGICTGYLGSIEQVDKILNFIDVFKTENTLLLVDPVMADGGEMYITYTEQMCNEMKALAARADVITPNLTELCILTDKDYKEVTAKQNNPDYLDYIKSIAESLINDTVKTVVVTGIQYNGNYIYNGIFTKDECEYSRTTSFDGRYSGTGDLFAAIIFGSLLKGESIKSALQKATSFIECAIEDTAKETNYDTMDGTNFEKFLKMLM